MTCGLLEQASYVVSNVLFVLHVFLVGLSASRVDVSIKWCWRFQLQMLSQCGPHWCQRILASCHSEVVDVNAKE